MDKKAPDIRLVRLYEIAQPLAEQFGLSLVEVKFGQQGKRRTIEVTIFRPDAAVSHADCEQMSRELEARLDQLNETGKPICEGSYMLEVQSPGIDRALKSERDYQVFAGQKVQLESKEKVADLGYSIVGVLLGLFGDKVKIAHARALKPKSKNEEPASTHEDITVSLAAITQIKLFAPDLQPKHK